MSGVEEYGNTPAGRRLSTDTAYSRSHRFHLHRHRHPDDPHYHRHRRHVRQQFGKPSFSGFQPHFMAGLGEFIGTTMFLFLAEGGAKTAQLSVSATQTQTATPLSNETIMFIATSFGLSLLVTAWMFYRITGGLFNPAITIALWLVGVLTTRRAVILFVSQILGGIAGAALILGLTPTNSVSQVTTTLQPGINVAQGFLIEMLLTSILVFTVLMMAVEKHRATFLAPVAIGLTLFACHLFGAVWTGCGMNPARSFGPAVVAGQFSSDHWIYWIAINLTSLIRSSLWAPMALGYVPPLPSSLCLTTSTSLPSPGRPQSGSIPSPPPSAEPAPLPETSGPDQGAPAPTKGDETMTVQTTEHSDEEMPAVEPNRANVTAPDEANTGEANAGASPNATPEETDPSVAVVAAVVDKFIANATQTPSSPSTTTPAARRLEGLPPIPRLPTAPITSPADRDENTPGTDTSPSKKRRLDEDSPVARSHAQHDPPPPVLKTAHYANGNWYMTVRGTEASGEAEIRLIQEGGDLYNPPPELRLPTCPPCRPSAAGSDSSDEDMATSESPGASRAAGNPEPDAHTRSLAEPVADAASNTPPCDVSVDRQVASLAFINHDAFSASFAEDVVDADVDQGSTAGRRLAKYHLWPQRPTFPWSYDEIPDPHPARADAVAAGTHRFRFEGSQNREGGIGLRDTIETSIANQVADIAPKDYMVRPPVTRARKLYVDVVVLNTALYEQIKAVDIRWLNRPVRLVFSGAPLDVDQVVFRLGGLDPRVDLPGICKAAVKLLRPHVKISDAWGMYSHTGASPGSDPRFEGIIWLLGKRLAGVTPEGIPSHIDLSSTPFVGREIELFFTGRPIYCTTCRTRGRHHLVSECPNSSRRF